jgi:hypothetical protein
MVEGVFGGVVEFFGIKGFVGGCGTVSGGCGVDLIMVRLR